MGAELSVSIAVFVRQPPATDGAGTGVVYRAISSHLIQKAGFTRKTAQTGAVTLIQRFGGALNLNVHFHMLFLDGVYTTTPRGKSRFRGSQSSMMRFAQLTASYGICSYLTLRVDCRKDVLPDGRCLKVCACASIKASGSIWQGQFPGGVVGGVDQHPGVAAGSGTGGIEALTRGEAGTDYRGACPRMFSRRRVR
jgi:hypothetical protein